MKPDTPIYPEFSDPRLVAIYDAVNPIESYTSFYLELADQLSATTVIDIGCGTGLLTYELAKRGHRMIGAEPSHLMLEAARERLRGKSVKLVEGTAWDLGEEHADLAIMTGHVAQFFLDDKSWQRALVSIHKALKSGGYIAFESRNQLMQPFTNWPTKTKPSHIANTPLGPIEWWSENLIFDGGTAHYEIHYRFIDTDEELVSKNELVFRSQEAITKSLQNAGFSVENIFGDWDKSPANDKSAEMIFVGKREG